MTTIIDGIEYLPIAEVARQLETTETRILMLLKQRILHGELVEGTWLVTTASVLGFDAQAQATAEPSSCRTSCTSSVCGCH